MQQQVDIINQQTGIAPKAIRSVLNLLSDGATVPFISRYRKDQIQNIDEIAVSAIAKAKKDYEQLEARKTYILGVIEEQGLLNSQLQQKIANTWLAEALEDLYLPFKRSKKTKAAAAKDLGLEPLAKIIMAQQSFDLDRDAKRFINHKVKSTADAIEGASHIVAEWISENTAIRESLRNSYRNYSRLVAKVVGTKKAEAAVYRDYFDYEKRSDKVPSHAVLAIYRGESEKLLRVKLKVDDDRNIDYLSKRIIKRDSSQPALVKKIFTDAYKRLLTPSIENEVRKEIKEKADNEAIAVFEKNLQQLLLEAPLGQKPILALDPGFKSGCKTAVIDDNGDLLTHTVVYPHEPQRQTQEASKTLQYLLDQHSVEAIAIGDGTASRETMDFVKSCTDIPAYVVRESGVSIYSASEIAQKEFPNLDLTVRGAISIGRRLMDPLSELVKVDPKSLGVGQYQHDVNQTQLQLALDQMVMLCVNKVGINLNTASMHVLQYVAGLGPTLAQNIVDYRKENGDFTSIGQLKKVKRLGAKAFEQAAGFLRIKNAKNPLDNTGVHPESYSLIENILEQEKLPLDAVIGQEEALNNIDFLRYATEQVGKHTLMDIKKELLKPGLDPRGAAQVFEFNDIRSMDDLRIGMKVNGKVSNLTNFGAFVDIGIKENGLLHISKIARERISSPTERLRINQKLEVTIIDLDFDRKRINLSLID